MANKRIAITKIGASCVAGAGSGAFAEALSAPKRLFGPSTKHELDFTVSVGEAPEDCFAAHNHPSLDSPTGRLCLSAARDCVAGLKEAPDGLVLGTSTGGQSKNEEVVFSLLRAVGPDEFDYRKQGCMAAPTRLVARDLNIVGPVQTVSTACTSSANAIGLGAAWIKNGRCRRVLAGGGDALCFTTISSFHMLELTGPELCTPFGPERPGLTLGEGAGFLLLEDYDEAVLAGRPVLAELLGVGMSSDAHHMTAPPDGGEGAELAIRRALDDAGLTPHDIDHINAHGTGTPLNDAAEAAAISRLFAPEIPVMSCKGLTGHTLGGAGGLEAVASVLSVVRNKAFQNLGAVVAGEDCPVRLVNTGGENLSRQARVVSNSFAFGGNNCSLVFGGPR